MKAKKIKFYQLKCILKNGFGFIAYGCEVDKENPLESWANLFSTELMKPTQMVIAKEDSFKEENCFSSIYQLTTSEGRTDLCFIFDNEKFDVDVGKLAMWKLQSGCSWIDDYIHNYKHQHIA